MRITDRRRASQQSDRWLRKTMAVEHGLLTVHPVARGNLVPGVVVWAHIPFQESAQWKLRPAVVIGRTGRTVLVHPITGATSRFEHDGYLDIEDLEAAGLDRARAIGARRTVEIDLIDVVSIAGRLSTVDQLGLAVAQALLPVLDLPSVGITRFEAPSHV